MVKGRISPKTSNKHLYIKKKGGLPDATLKKGKSSILQAYEGKKCLHQYYAKPSPSPRRN